MKKRLILLGVFVVCAVLIIAALSEDTGKVDLDSPEMEVIEETMQIKIGETAVTVDWEDNATVSALRELVKKAPLTIQMSMYGGFEQVGSLGTSLVRDDVQTVTQAGDIVLYSGNQIVVFYGSNSWAYTRLGKITDRNDQELAELLGNGDMIITLYMN